MYVIEIILIAFFNGFWVFLIAKIISGIGVSLSSGTGQALLFDTLKKQKREDKYKKISGTLGVITNISMAFVFIIGAFLFSIDPKLPALISLPFINLGLILTFFLEEPYENGKKFNFKNHFTQIKEGLIFFYRSDYLKYFAFMSFFVATMISITFSLSSAYLEKILIPISLIGVAAFVSSMVTAFSSKKADKWEENLGEKKSIYLIQFLVLLGLFLISLFIPYLGYLFYLVIPFVSGFNGIIIGNYINKHIESSHRATILSIGNMFGNIGIFLIFPLIGYIQKITSLKFSFFILSMITLIGFILLYIYSRKINIRFKKPGEI